MSIDSHDSQFSTNDSRRYRPGMDRKDIREKEQSDRDRHQSLPIRSWGTRTIAAFEIIEIIGAGTYAYVKLNHSFIFKSYIYLFILILF